MWVHRIAVPSVCELPWNFIIFLNPLSLSVWPLVTSFPVDPTEDCSLSHTQIFSLPASLSVSVIFFSLSDMHTCSHTRGHTCTPVSPVGPVWSVTFFPSEALLWSRRAWGEIGQFNPPSIASFFPSWALTASLSLPFSCPCWLVCPTGVYLLLSLCLAQHPPWQCKAIIFLFSLVASLSLSLPLSTAPTSFSLSLSAL